jgi:hypothetical protein
MTAPDAQRAQLEAAHAELVALRPRVEGGGPWQLAERFDHAPEASWGPPELLAHVAEMLPYWLGEVERILAAEAEPVPFGRVGDDPIRIALIGRDRTLPIGELYRRIGQAADRWSDRLPTLTEQDLASRGLHSTRGEMSVSDILDRMVAGHLAEHVRQLASILDAGT